MDECITLDLLSSSSVEYMLIRWVSLDRLVQ